MSDIAFNLLLEKIKAQTLSNQSLRSLWLLDENTSATALEQIVACKNISLMTNRSDLAEGLQLLGAEVYLSDFDFSVFDTQAFDHIYYRVSKEKAVVNYIINQSAIYLKKNGCLHLSGYKNEGTKTYIEKAAKFLGRLESKELGGKTAMIASLRCSHVDQAQSLDDKHYEQYQQVIKQGEISFISKPGVFGWNKIDKGSAFLIEYLPAVLQKIDMKIKRVADLGCGYGYLSVMASQLVVAEFDAVDNNVAAVSCCEKNFQQYGLKGKISLDSCGDKLSAGFDLLLCNPPFHQGFDVDNSLTDSFLSSASRLLKKGGSAFFVVNAFIPLERKAVPYFNGVEMVANNKSFKLLLLTK